MTGEREKAQTRTLPAAMSTTAPWPEQRELGGEPRKEATDHRKINGGHVREEGVEVNSPREITTVEEARRRRGARWTAAVGV